VIVSCQLFCLHFSWHPRQVQQEKLPVQHQIQISLRHPCLPALQNGSTLHIVDVWSSHIWSRIRGNANRRDQSHMNTSHEVLDSFRPLRGVIVIRPVLMYYTIKIGYSLFLSDRPRCRSILSIYSRETAS
jgi:hypothetical protein